MACFGLLRSGSLESSSRLPGVKSLAREDAAPGKWATDDDIAKTLSYLETVCLHRCPRNRCWLEPLAGLIIHTKDCLWQLPSKSLFQRLRRESGLAELEEGRAHLEAIRHGWPSALYSEPGLQRARAIGGKEFWLIPPIELFPGREEELSFWLHPHP